MLKKLRRGQGKLLNSKRDIKDGPVNDLYPLLSDYQIKNYGLPEGVAGEFSVQSDICGGIASVLEDMIGRTDHRASIPHVYSQQKAFQVTIGHYNPKGKTPEAIAQWRGTVALMLLYPFFFGKGQMPVWRTNHDSFQQGNIFADVLKAFLGPKNDGTMDQFTALCVTEGSHTYPLLQVDAQCMAVPAAYGIEERYISLPWLDLPETQPLSGPTTQIFTDPIRHLGTAALSKLDGMLDTLIVQKKCSSVLEAVKAFRKDISAEITERLKRPAKAYAVEVMLLKALLLRNAIDTGIHVVRRPEATLNSIELGGKRPFTTHAANDLLSGIFPSEAAGKYNVLLGTTLIAHIDEEHLLWCPSPETATGQDEYDSLCQRLDEALDDPDLRQLLVYQVRNLCDVYQKPDTPVLAALIQELNEDLSEPILNDLSISWALSNIIDEETDFDESAFSPFQLKSFAKGNPDTFFAEQLLGIATDQPQSVPDGVMLRLLGSDGMSVMYFKPLGAYGGAVYSARRNRNIELKLERVGKEQIRALVVARDNHILYTQEKLYTINVDCQIMLHSSMPFPSIGVWPNIDDSLRREWSIYYAIVCFNFSRHTALFDADVYDVDGNKVDDKKKTSHGESQTELYRRWQVFDVGNQPSFALIKYKGNPVGFVSLTGDKTPQFGTERDTGNLCIDFGTTSTIGFFQKRNDTPQQVSLENNRLEWILNERDGYAVSNRFFISAGFALRDVHGCALLSLFQTFPPEQDNSLPVRSKDNCELHLDGNIFFIAGDEVPTNHNDRIQTRMKTKLQTGSDISSYVRAYLQQIFQFYFLRCRLEHITTVVLRCAYPLAFMEEERQKLYDLFESTANAVADQAGIHIDNIIYKSESLAVGKYFANRRKLTMLDTRKGIMVLDIGGGTSDFSFSVNRAGTNEFESLLCCSCHLAGWKMLSQFIQRCIQNGSITNFISDLRSINAANGQLFVTRWLDHLGHLHAGTENLDGIVTLYMDQFMKQSRDVLKAAFDAGKCAALQENLTLCIGLLFWLARLIYTEHTRRRNTQQSIDRMDLCLAGNGSALYRILPVGVCARLQQLVSVNGLTVSVLDNDDELYKTEVAEGLLRVHDQDDDAVNSDCALSIDNTVTDFIAFMQSYINLFPGEQPALRMQRLIDNTVELDVFIHDLDQHLSNVQTLGAYLSELADKFSGL